MGVATISLGLALSVRINEAYGTVEEDEIEKIDAKFSVTSSDKETHASSEASSHNEEKDSIMNNI